MDIIEFRVLAIVGFGLPFAAIALSGACDLGLPIRWLIGDEPLSLILGAFPLGMMAYLPWIHHKFNEYGTIAVVGIAIVVLICQFSLAVIFSMILFAIGGDTI